MIRDYINIEELKIAFRKFKNADPFDHCVIENFFLKDIALKLENEFPDYEDKMWQGYNNPLEVKKLTNIWNHFKPLTYKIVSEMNSIEFSTLISELAGIKPLYSDDGLNGGGLHIHKSGGRLNPHLDYSIHPKLGLQRKLNIIIYLNSVWNKDWGGDLGLWDTDPNHNSPGKIVKRIKPIFNSAVIFDTTQNSWHGMVGDINSPPGQYRKSLALYYLTDPPENSEKRGKALFSPTEEQKGNKEIEELIKKRSSEVFASSVYQKK